MARADDPQHPIQVVVRRTGLTADVIRAWERRYKAVSPSRSSTRRRLYSDEEIERLKLLQRATAAGRRIGEISDVPSDRLSALLATDEAEAARVRSAPQPRLPEEVRNHLEACIQAIQLLDGQLLEERLRQASLELSTPTLIDGLLMPLLRTIGDRWQARTMGVHHEHLATAGIRPLLETLRSDLTRPLSQSEIVVATPVGQVHELGALTAGVVAASAGWRVTYLGADVPAEDLITAVTGRGARALGLSVLHPADDPRLVEAFEELGARLPRGVSLLVGGSAVGSYHAVLKKIGAVEMSDFEALRRRLSHGPDADGSGG